MGIRKDLTGQRFGKLVAISSHMDAQNRRCVWVCKCDCGNYTEAKTVSLTHGLKQSCGCLQRKILNERNTKHGDSKTRLYKVWKGMLSRCDNKNHISYANYGGRGIKVCDEWKNNFTKFKEWAIKAGYDENAKHYECTIDRIDTNGNYCPENCRWIPNSEQANNTRIVRRFLINGEEHTLTDWCTIYNIPKGNVQARLQLGWDIEKALSTPVRKCKKRW